MKTLVNCCVLLVLFSSQSLAFLLAEMKRTLARREGLQGATSEYERNLRALPYLARALNKRSEEGTGKVSFRECNLSEGEREDCGYFGITEGECYSRGCCWGQTQAFDVPWCYHSIPTMLPQCVMDVQERVECGSYGIRKETCLTNDCCWQPTNEPSAPWCFHQTKTPIFSGECGIPAVMPNVLVRIVGGEDATPHSWPWMASLKSGGDHFCGGSLISAQWVLTAAHCQPGFDWSPERSVVLGNHLNSQQDPYEVEVEIEEIIPHPEYSDSTFSNDVMLLKLAEPVEMTDGVSPVCLPVAGEDYTAGRHCYSTGWGHTQWMGQMPETLQQVLIPLIDRDVCNGEEWYNGKIDTTMVCAGYEEGGRDACQGDSGGPLVCYNHENENWQLTGVVSWGEACAYERRPGLYSNVGQFIEWIEDTIKENN